MAAALFRQGTPGLFKLFLLIGLSIGLMIADQHLHRTEWLRATLGTVTGAAHYVLSRPSHWLSNWQDERRMADALHSEVERLREENLLLKGQMQQFWSMSEENRRLRSLLNGSRLLDHDILLAEVISAAPDPWRHQILINRGSRAGVHIGQPVVDAEGIVGQVRHVTPLTAEILLITAPRHAIPVMIPRTGQRGVLHGTGHRQHLSLEHIPDNAEINTDDIVVASGQDGVFPGGFPVGRISSVQRAQGGPFARIEVQPFADLERLQEVLLVSSKYEDIQPPVRLTTPPPSNCPEQRP
ncbi:MAG: rod shape-determining protein MreC [Halothiobacillaceae bacterium]|nr:rod shape-determining protein MreC [Halothiobacillaceae bacterium]